MDNSERLDPGKFKFRGLHPDILIGMASDEMMNPEMIDDAIETIMEGVRRRKRMNLIINNRAGGNAPMIAQQIAKIFSSNPVHCQKMTCTRDLT